VSETWLVSKDKLNPARFFEYLLGTCIHALRSLLRRTSSLEPRTYGPEGPICLRRVEAAAPSFLGPVAARFLAAYDPERRAPLDGRPFGARTCLTRYAELSRSRSRSRCYQGVFADSHLVLLMDLRSVSDDPSDFASSFRRPTRQARREN